MGTSWIIAAVVITEVFWNKNVYDIGSDRQFVLLNKML